MTSMITTHVLDLALGKPAERVAVVLARQTSTGQWAELARDHTDADGRIKSWPAGTSTLEEAVTLEAGVYRLEFATDEYFRRTARPSFHPTVAIHFEVADPADRYHVPLLLSPFGYSTYRGS